jgi:magnesium transporter
MYESSNLYKLTNYINLDKARLKSIVFCFLILHPLIPFICNLLLFSARERAIVVNLEHIRAIVTADEILILDPLCQEVLPFIDQLRQHVPLKTTTRAEDGDNQGTEAPSEAERELPFEFQVLETALEVVCSSLSSSVTDLERDAYPVLDELANNVSTKNLERVRSLKSILTRLFARIQKVCRIWCRLQVEPD